MGFYCRFDLSNGPFPFKTAAFQVCLGQQATDSCGQAFEFLADGMISLDDFAEFVRLLTGP